MQYNAFLDEETAPGDPLGLKNELTPETIKNTDEKVTNYDFLKSVGKLSQNTKLFNIYHASSDQWDAAPAEKVDYEAFAAGEIEGHLGLWLEGGTLGTEPVARWKGSIMNTAPLKEQGIYDLKRSGSVILADYLTSQIVKGFQTYFNAKRKLEKTSPDHPALKNAPQSITEEHVEQMLWLQYWNFALTKRETKSYNCFKQPLNYAQRVALVYSDIPLEKKIVLSHLNLLTPNYIEEYRDIPVEWIFRLKGVEDKISNREAIWGMPEIHKDR